jgi:hypothetical protein
MSHKESAGIGHRDRVKSNRGRLNTELAGGKQATLLD